MFDDQRPVLQTEGLYLFGFGHRSHCPGLILFGGPSVQSNDTGRAPVKLDQAYIRRGGNLRVGTPPAGE